MERADPLARGWMAATLRGARTAFAGWALWVTVCWAHAASAAFIRVQVAGAGSGVGAYFGLYTKAAWGTVAAAELVLAAALIPLAQTLADRRTRLLIGIASGSAAGGALLLALALVVPVPQPLGVLQAALRAAAPASFVWAIARVLRSDDARTSWTLLGAAAAALVVRAAEALAFARQPDQLLAWALLELDYLAAALPLVAAYLLARHVQRGSGEAAPRRALDPYRVAEPSGEDAADRERRRGGQAAADRLQLHSGAAFVYGATAAAGVLLFAYQEDWHKFYANAAVIEFTVSLQAAALLVMAAALPHRGAAGPGTPAAFPGRWSTVLVAALELTAGAMTVSASRPLASSSVMENDFWRALAARDARFQTAALLAFLGGALALATLARLAGSFQRLAASAGEPALAQRAWQLAILAGVLAGLLGGATLLGESGSLEIAVALGSLRQSWLVQAALAAAVLVITGGHVLVARGVARILEGDPPGGEDPR